MEQGEGQRDEILALKDKRNTYKADLLKEWEELLEARKSLTNDMRTMYDEDLQRRRDENAKQAARIETLEEEVAKLKKNESSHKRKG